MTAKKTQLLLLGRKRKRELAQVRASMLVERSTCMKCLGVMLDVMERTRAECEKEVQHRIGQIEEVKNVLPSRTKKQLYNALVLPHLDYCSVVKRTT